MGLLVPPRRALLRLSLAVSAAVAVAVVVGIAMGGFGGIPGIDGVRVAHADNELVSTNPADGTSLGTSPTSIVLTFASPVGSQNTVVATCNGTQFNSIGNPAVSTDRLSLTVAVVSPMPKGSCRVSYLVSAPDNTPNGRATFGFTITADPPAGTSIASTTVPGGTSTEVTGSTTTTTVAATSATDDDVIAGPQKVGGPLGVARLVAALGLAVLLGSLVLIAIAWPEGIEYVLTVRFLRGWWVFSLLGTALTVVLLTMQVTGKSFGAALPPTAWSDLKESTPGVAALVRVAATAACGWTVIRPERCVDQATQLPALAFPVVAVATYGFSRTGDDLAAVGIAMGVGHAVAMSVWLGGLILLTRVVLAGPGEDDLVHAVRGYNRMSGPALAITVITGAVQTYRLDRNTLFDTSHGRVVIFKALIVAAMVFVGLMTRQFVNSAVRRTEVMTAPLASRLRRATGIEAIGGVIVVALSAWLLALVPGGVAASVDDGVSYGSQTTFVEGDLSVTVSLTGEVGENGVKVQVVQPATGLSGMQLTFTPPEGTSAFTVVMTMPLELTGTAIAVLPEAIGIPLQVAGTWTLQLTATTPTGPHTIVRSFLLLS